jgi:hypothetical protein
MQLGNILLGLHQQFFGRSIVRNPRFLHQMAPTNKREQLFMT